MRRTMQRDRQTAIKIAVSNVWVQFVTKCNRGSICTEVIHEHLLTKNATRLFYMDIVLNVYLVVFLLRKIEENVKFKSMPTIDPKHNFKQRNKHTLLTLFSSISTSSIVIFTQYYLFNSSYNLKCKAICIVHISLFLFVFLSNVISRLHFEYLNRKLSNAKWNQS